MHIKRLSAFKVTLILLSLFNSITYSQVHNTAVKTKVIEPYRLLISCNKTTNLIFPYSIKSVDRGSRDVLAQKAIGVENVLFVKAGTENFNQTNLSVITADGKLYSFLIDYTIDPATLNISFAPDTASNGNMPLLLPEENEAEVQSLTERIAKERKIIHGIKNSKFKFLFRLQGIYIKNDVIYYKLELKNHSNINYDVGMLRFFIKDQKKSKRTASQEIEILPLYIHGDTSVIRGQSKNIIVYALPKFTIPDKKFMAIDLMERNGGRHLHLYVQNRLIVNARLLNK